MKSTKSLLTFLLSLVCVFCFSVGVITLTASRPATVGATITGNALTQTVDSFGMEGAQVRVAGDKSGLRFVASVDKTEYDALVGAYETVEMGMLVIPKNKLTGELTLDNDIDAISKVKRTGLTLVENGDKYEFRAVLLDIPSASFGRDILGRAFLTISDGVNEKTFYADAITRNIAYVSYVATEVLGAESNETYEAYIGDRVFHAISLPSGASCEYLYAYEGQTVDIEFSGDAEVDFGGAAVVKNGDVYSVTVGSADIAATATVDLGSFETLVDDGTFAIGAISGNVTSITSGFTYDAGVLSTTNLGGEYDVSIVTDAGFVYNANAIVITEVISSASQLSAFASRSNNGYYVLGNNINARGCEFMNAGATFSGTFDGRGYAISNGTYISPNDNNLSGGLFGTISAGATVKNVALISSTLQGEYSWSSCSPLTGNANCNGTIKDVYMEITSIGVKNGDYNSTYVPTTAIGLFGHAGDGSVIDHVIVKSVAGLNYNVCNMVLGNAHITNAYVIGGGSTNNGWVQTPASSVVSISKVASLSAAQQESFDSSIWTFVNGLPVPNYTDIDVTVDLFLDGADGDMTFSLTDDLGIASGTVSAVSFNGESVLFTQVGANVTVSAAAGEAIVMIEVGGKKYFFGAIVITQKIDNASELSAFASRSNSGYYILGDNIDASALTLMNTSATFSGTFDGRGYAIKGATYSSANGNLAGGLLGTMDYGATVKNLAITGATLTTEADYNWVYTSVLTGGGRIRGTIKDCYIEITSKGSSTHAMGIGCHGEDVVVDHVILKSVGGLEKNICDMYLGTSSISNTYVIGGVATNTGWNQNSSPVSIANVASLSAAQQASFDPDIWMFIDGMPSFVKCIDFSSAISTGKTLTLDSADHTVTLEDLELVGTLTNLYDADGKAAGENLTSSQVDVLGTVGETETFYAIVSGTVYSFDVFSVTEVIDNASELSAFASRSNSGYYILGDNIDASALTLMNTSATFDGIFDGRGYSIKGATYSSANGNLAGGLFGTMNYGSTVKNLALTGSTLTTEADYNWVFTSVLTGGGRIRGTIKDCYIEITAKGSSTHAMGIGSHGEDVTIDHVILKSVGGLEKNICDMYLGTSSITNTYVIGGVATNTGWNQNSSPVSIANVASLSSAQQASFDPEIWTFIDGIPYFTKDLTDLSSATPLAISAPTVYANAGDGQQEVKFASLGVSGSVTGVWDGQRKALDYSSSANGFTPSGLRGGENTVYAEIGGTLYSFPVILVNKVIKTSGDLSAFAASHEQDGYYLLGNDIDASSLSFTTSNIETDGLGFTGIFDGQGFAIDGAFIGNGGLFGGIATGGVVKNLAFTNTEYGYSGPGSAFGGHNYGTIDNCYIKVVKQGEAGRGGAQQTYCALSALSNYNYGTISNCVTSLPEFGTGEHKAVCQINYGTLVNIYCVGTEETLTYSTGGGTMTNVFKSSTSSVYSRGGFDPDYWSFTTFNFPLFKSTQIFDLVSEGASDYTILRGNDDIAIEAAEELQKYFKLATGVTLSIYDLTEYAAALAEAPRFISVGSTYHLHGSGLWYAIGSGNTGSDDYGLGMTGYAIDTIDGNVYITGFYNGNDLHGTLNGVYGWLNRQFGLEIYAADEYSIRTGCTNEILTLVDEAVVPDINALVGGNSDSYGNKALGYYTTNGASGLMTGAYGSGNIQPVHNFLDFLPQNPAQSAESNYHGVSVDENYGSTLGTAPKNNFNDGYTYYWDNAYGNRNVYDICLAQNEANVIPKLLDRMATLTAWVGAKHQKYICFSHEDGSFWCPHCRKKFAQGGTGYATEQEYITMTYARFMIRLANAMKADERFNGITLVMLHYGLSSAMPASGSAGNYTLDSNIASYMSANGLTLPDNLAVMITYQLRNNYGTGTVTPLSNDIDVSAVTDTVNRYKTITNRFLLWTYYENYQNYFAPFDAMNQVQANMRFAESIGAEYYYPQAMSNVGTNSVDWGALENYVISKLRWNVDADVNTLINNFFICYYGSASTQMKALYDSYIDKIARLHNFNGYGYGYGGTVNKVNGAQYEYISTGCWSQAELEGFLDQIDAAKATLKAGYDGGTIPIGRYNQLLNRVKIEELTFKYMYIKLYTSAAVNRFEAASDTALKNAFVTECTSLGVTNWKEGGAVSASMFN